MNTRPPRCAYTRAGLEVWLDRLTPEWECRFSREEVEHGRELYRQGCIRDISVDVGEAMVAGAWDELAAHVVFYWRDDGLHWRGSLDRPLHINALAVAGLYAIEELLVAEVPDLPSDPAPVTPVAAASPGVVSPAVVAPPATPPVAPSSRRLVVVFALRPEGLSFTARWDEPGRARRAVFGAGAPEAARLAPADRDAVLRLATAARKAGFVFDTRAARHRFESAEALPRFVRDTLPVWRTRFALEGDDALACLAGGVRELELGALISPAADDGDAAFRDPDGHAHGDGGFHMEWRVGLDGEWFERDTVRALLARGEFVSIVPGRGLVRLAARDAATVADWPQAAHGAFPPYLMLSLFRDQGLKLEADPALAAWRDAMTAPPAPPADAPAFLRPYQAAGAAWLAAQADRGAHPLLADEMGLGKTVQVLALLLALRPAAAPSLIVCPASVVPVWQGEIEKFFPGTPVAVMGKGRRFDESPAPRVWICSYTQLRRRKAPESVKFGYAVLDEAQFIKNPDAKVTQACFAVRADHRLALSGTPIENRPGDLWALFRFLMPGLLGRRKGFESGFATDARASAERLRAQISPFVLRRTKREVARELPAKVEAVLPCPLTDLQREEYCRLVSGGLEEFGAGASPAAGSATVNLLALLTRLRQVSCDPALLPWRSESPPEQSGKLTVLAEKLSEIIAGGGKTVVFSQFTTLLDRVAGLLRHRFPETPVWSLTGESRDRAAPVAAFQKAAGSGVILVSLKAGGTGVTLTAGDYVFLLDPWWNPAAEAQAVDRVHRIGRDRTVFVYRMIATDTIEDRIERLKSAKRELFDRVVGDIPDLSDWREHFPTLEALIALSGEGAAASSVGSRSDDAAE